MFGPNLYIVVRYEQVDDGSKRLFQSSSKSNGIWGAQMDKFITDSTNPLKKDKQKSRHGRTTASESFILKNSRQNKNKLTSWLVNLPPPNVPPPEIRPQ